MSDVLHAIEHELGIIKGILIPGASASTAITTQAIQQQVANVYGAAITKAVQDFAPRNDISGPAKANAIATAVATDMIDKGVKAELKHLRDVALDVVQAAYRALEPNIGAAIVAIATALHAGPALTTVAELAAPLIQAEADKALPAAA